MLLTVLLILAIAISQFTIIQATNCQPQTLYTIESVVSQGCTIIGALILNSTNYTNLNGLEQVSWIQNLQITNNPLLSNITLPNYNPSYGAAVLNINNNPLLSTLSFPVLTQLTGQINNNQILASLYFPALTQLTGQINNNPLLFTLSSPVLFWLNGQINDNPSLETISFPALTQFYSPAKINNNSLLANLSFPMLNQFAGQINNNPTLTKLSFPALTYLNGQINNNPLLEALSFPALTQFIGQINNNPQLKTVSFPGLIYFLGQINNNTLLVTLTFPILGQFNGQIGSGVRLHLITTPYNGIISNNQFLTRISFPSLTLMATTDIQIINNPNLISVHLSGLSSLNYLDIVNNSRLTDLDMPKLKQIYSLNLNSIPVNNLLPITGSLLSATTITLQNLPYLTSLNGLTVPSSGLVISQLPLLKNLRGLALDTIPSDQQLIIDNNDGLTSLDGLQRLIRVLGQLQIQNNINLVDYTALSNVLLLASPVIVNQCCPAFSFIQPPSLFNIDSTFKCRICAKFSTTIPNKGPVSGGTNVLIATNGTIPAPTLYFQFGSNSILCSYQPIQMGYLCPTPASLSPGLVSIQVSFDGNQTFNATEASFTYQNWQTITGINLAFTTSSTQVEYSNEAISTTHVDPLPALPASHTGYANTVANNLAIAGACIVAVIYLSMLLIRLLFTKWGKKLPEFLSRHDYIQLNQKDVNQRMDDGYIVFHRTSVFGGIITISAYVMVIFIVIAYLAQTFIDPDNVSTSLSPSNSRTIAPSMFTATIELQQFNGACDCSNSNPTLTASISGFAPIGNFSCISKINPVGISNCMMQWSCNRCSQTGLVSLIQLSTTDSNAFMLGFLWSFTVNSYLNTSLQASGSVLASTGRVFKGSSQISQVPLSITPASYSDHSRPVLFGHSIDAGIVLPGAQQTTSTLGSDSGLTVQLSAQQNIVWIDVIITSRFTNLAVLAQVSAIAGGILATARLLVSFRHTVYRLRRGTTKSLDDVYNGYTTNPAVQMSGKL